MKMWQIRLLNLRNYTIKGNINIMNSDKVIDVNIAKSGIYYFVDTFYNTISKIDFIGYFEETVTTDWYEPSIFTNVKYYNHFFHETFDSGSKIEETMRWNKSSDFLFLTLDDAIEFLIDNFHNEADKERKQLENKIKNKAEELDKYLDKCDEDTIKFI